MATESEGQRNESGVLISPHEEDTFDGPRTYEYKPFASPWYTDCNSILMLAFLTAVLLMGTIFLTNLAFTKDPWLIVGITAGYLILSFGLIVLSTCLSKLRH